MNECDKANSIDYCCFKIHLLCTYSDKMATYVVIKLRARKRDPPTKKPRFPPNSPTAQVKSQAKCSSLYSIAKSEKAICRDRPDLQLSHLSHFMS